MNGAVLYTRVSTAEQAKDNNSLAVQEQRLRDYCKHNGLKIIRAFEDAGESARTTERPQFQAMLAFCRQNKKQISHLVVCNLSRFSRDVADTALTVATLESLGIKLVSVDEPVINETAVGKLSRNILASFGQFFSDDLSEKTRYRMRAAVNEGRFVWVAPIGYQNQQREKGQEARIIVDPERGPLVRNAFELMASGRYATGDAVLRAVTAMGLVTRKGNSLTKQSFARMLQNPIYAGWIVTGELKVRGTHDPLVSDELFQQVQDKINGKSSPHKQVSEDFPLRGFARCSSCEKNLTAGWAKGRKDKYARYWCWTKGCGAIGISSGELERHWLVVLSRMQPTAKLIAMLPEIAARQWETRKVRIGKDAEMLSKRLADQTTLNQKLITAKLNGEITPEDFQTMKASIATETERINEQISALDSERSTMKDLMQQANMQVVDLVDAWQKANVNQKQELARGLFPEGLLFSMESKFFEPRNVRLTNMSFRWLDENPPEGIPVLDVGVPDGI